MSSTNRRTRTRVPLPRTEVEYLILADAAEALGGKLYLMGGGWDSVQIADFQRPVPVAIACGVLVPWNETDEDHSLTIGVHTEDGEDVTPPVAVRFKTGRSPGMERGASTHVPFVLKAEVQLPGSGGYSVSATVDERPETRRTFQFWARAANAAP